MQRAEFQNLFVILSIVRNLLHKWIVVKRFALSIREIKNHLLNMVAAAIVGEEGK
ncbi:MAG TPA: hypothetical protein VE619_02365 [Nitrososphaeraceae archaeon]|nr:hypothetical protein [Nitrososphaeraceae archaeon]